MSKHVDRTGMRFGRLVVERLAGVSKTGVGIWECRCDCGNRVQVWYSNLHNGITHSCGCLRLEVLVRRSTKHGLTGGHGHYTRLYRIWLHLRARCLNPHHKDYNHYGGRGIKVCSEWNDYKAFHDWAMSHGYAAELTIDRIDNNGPYAPGNCQWSTRSEQSQNTSIVRHLAYKGETLTLTQWAIRLGVKRGTLHSRLALGWPVELAFTTPLKGKALAKGGA